MQRTNQILLIFEEEFCFYLTSLYDCSYQSIKIGVITSIETFILTFHSIIIITFFNKHDYLYHVYFFSSPFSEQPALSEPQYTTPPCYAMHPPSLKPGAVQYLHSQTHMHAYSYTHSLSHMYMHTHTRTQIHVYTCTQTHRSHACVCIYICIVNDDNGG